MPEGRLPDRPAVLATARLRLEPLGPEHAARLFTALCAAEVYQFIPQAPPGGIAALETRYRRVAAGPPSPHERWWNWVAIPTGEPTAALGTVEVTLLDDGRRGLLAYVFGRAAWGRGFAYEACRAVCSYLAAAAGTRELEALIDTRNARSIALAERLGFACGQRVDNADYFKGSSSDEFHYRLSLLKDDDGETLGR